MCLKVGCLANFRACVDTAPLESGCSQLGLGQVRFRSSYSQCRTFVHVECQSETDWSLTSIIVFRAPWLAGRSCT